MWLFDRNTTVWSTSSACHYCCYCTGGAVGQTHRQAHQLAKLGSQPPPMPTVRPAISPAARVGTGSQVDQWSLPSGPEAIIIHNNQLCWDSITKLTRLERWWQEYDEWLFNILPPSHNTWHSRIQKRLQKNLMFSLLDYIDWANISAWDYCTLHMPACTFF